MRSFAPLGLVLPFLIGCALSPTAPLSSTPHTTPEAGIAITGTVHGGQQPVVGEHVYLFAANTSGSGGNGITASSSNASVSLLTSAVGSNNPGLNGFDGAHYYVITDANGNFSLTGDYACTAGQQVYIYGIGGDTGSGTNSAAGLIAVLGACPGPAFSSGLFISMNEVSTVAAAYAFAGWATDALHVSSDAGVSGNAYAAQAAAGMANAFANAANLETLGTGVALATTPAGNGTAPQETVNTLANILAACVNTTGPAGTGCSTLLPTATSNGIPIGSAGAGRAATDTATAAIYIAQNPGTNVAALYGLATGMAPFGSALTAQPNDFTLGITITDSGLVFGPFTYNNPPSGGIAIDAQGNAWIASGSVPVGPNLVGSNIVTKLSSTGSLLFHTNSGGINDPVAVAIDQSGNAWVANGGGNGGGSLTELSSTGLGTNYNGSGSPLGSYGNGGVGDPLAAASSIAIDNCGDIWVASFSDGVYTQIEGANSGCDGLGAPIGGLLSDENDVDFASGVAVDGAGNVWIPQTVVRAYDIISVEGFEDSEGPSIPLGSVAGVAVDSAGNVWMPGLFSTPDADYWAVAVTDANTATFQIFNPGGGLNNPTAIAIDGSGDPWLANGVGVIANGNSVTRLSTAGTAISGSGGYQGGGMYGPQGIAIDGSGDVWVVNSNSNGAVELIGAATPVITPISAGLLVANFNNYIPSRLGTRP